MTEAPFAAPPGRPMAVDDAADYWAAHQAWLRHLFPELFTAPVTPAPPTTEAPE